MGKILSKFLECAEDNEKTLSIEALLSEEERVEWETLVKAFDTIDIMHVGKDLDKINKIFKLNRWQDMAILAYVKILEMMMKRAKDAGAMDMMESMQPTPTEIDYSGSMFG